MGSITLLGYLSGLGRTGIFHPFIHIHILPQTYRDTEPSSQVSVWHVRHWQHKLPLIIMIVAWNLHAGIPE